MSSMPPIVLPPLWISPTRHHSASAVAENDALYASWSLGAKVQMAVHDSQELKDMVHESRKFPLWLKDQVEDESNVLFSPLFLELKFLLTRSQYSFGKTPTNTHFRESMSFILMLSQHHRLLAAERVSGELRPNEADSRIPLDALISFIFRTLEPYEGNKMRQICECPLTLPASSLALSSAIADLAVCIRMTNFCLPLPQHVRNEITAIDFDAADQVSPNLLVLHWLVEYKWDTTGYRHLSFYLAAAVHQHRALGFPEHYVFGAAQTEVGEITTYAATWSESLSKVLVYPLESYSLRQPDRAASFFLFIRCVAKKAIKYQEQLAKKAKELLPPSAPGYQTWKAPPPPPSDRGGRKRKWGDDIGPATDSVSGSEGTSGAVQEGIEPDLDKDEHRDFMEGDTLWSRELTQWAQEAVESHASLGDRGEPLRAKSVRSLGYVDFLPV